jgi:hypothetical protein
MVELSRECILPCLMDPFPPALYCELVQRRASRPRQEHWQMQGHRSTRIHRRAGKPRTVPSPGPTVMTVSSGVEAIVRHGRDAAALAAKAIEEKCEDKHPETGLRLAAARRHVEQTRRIFVEARVEIRGKFGEARCESRYCASTKASWNNRQPGLCSLTDGFALAKVRLRRSQAR